MRPFLFSLIVLTIAACVSKRRSDDRDPSGQNQKAGSGSNTGILDGNGGEIRPRNKLDLPNRSAVEGFLEKLSGPEFAWTYLLKKGLNSSNPKAPQITGSDEPCYLREAPTIEVRAYYNKVTNVLILCRPYFVGDETERLAIVLHELTHVALYDLLTNLGDEEEDIVQLFEATYRKLASDTNAEDYNFQVLELRALLDRHVPKLIGIIEDPELSIAELVGPVDDVKVLKEGSVTFPSPKSISAEGYLPPHFLEYALNHYWTREPRFLAADLLTRPTVDPTAVEDVRYFTYADWSYEQRFVVKEIPVRSPDADCKEVVCMPKLVASVLDANELSEPFLGLLRSPHYHHHWIRTIGRYEEIPGGWPQRRDHVFYIQGMK